MNNAQILEREKGIFSEIGSTLEIGFSSTTGCSGKWRPNATVIAPTLYTEMAEYALPGLSWQARQITQLLITTPNKLCDFIAQPVITLKWAELYAGIELDEQERQMFLLMAELQALKPGSVVISPTSEECNCGAWWSK